ncbi:hypothetical protein [Paraburkholderia sp. RL17-381-BIF-C]|uniref:hypothetical protein n=1 Tax=Paraburkholderia sp. RL17-381-BIF-C TaxID=3031635 RepID=UPI0038BDF8AC
MVEQASTQNDIVVGNPPAQLHWYFMQRLSYRYFTRAFTLAAPLIRTELRPLL